MRKRHALSILPAAALISGSAPALAAPPACDGLPRMAVQSARGFCVGLVADGLKAPRGLQVLANGDIVVADMGSWLPGRGRIWLLKNSAGHYDKQVLFDHLDRPNSVAIAPDGAVFVGMVNRVARLDLKAARPALVDVIGGSSAVAPLPGDGRHLLPSLLFDARGDLFVSVGSASDHCEGADGQAPAAARCAEREGANARGVIRKYHMRWPGGTPVGWEVYAKGLRNSMAMSFDRNGQLWQADNGRDAIGAAMPGLKNDDELPHDELNLVERGADYGWPYCYDDNRSNPEFSGAGCASYRAPRRLLPAHAAPLGMAFYSGDAYPARFSGSLVVSYHGYRQHGHRVVALLPGRNGAPLGNSIDLVTGSRQNGKHLGAPVGVSLGPDGKVYLADDHEGVIVRLSYEGGER
jgi:glucose/arabinose dehydrogenase